MVKNSVLAELHELIIDWPISSLQILQVHILWLLDNVLILWLKRRLLG